MAIVIIIPIINASFAFGEKNCEIPPEINGFAVAEHPIEAKNNEDVKCFGQNNCYDKEPNFAGEVMPETSGEPNETSLDSARENCSCQLSRSIYNPYKRASRKTAILTQPHQHLFEYQLTDFEDNDNYTNILDMIFDVNHTRYIDLYPINRYPEFSNRFQFLFDTENMCNIRLSETCSDNDHFGCIKIISLESTVNLYGQIISKYEDSDPLPDITIEVENTDISCTTGIDGDFILQNVPIKKQKLNFYDADHEYIESVEILFNIDGGDICMCSLHKMIIDVGNIDGKIFTNIQICFEVDLENRTLYYEEDKIRGNVESAKNKTIYTVICILFVLVFLSVIIFVGKKKA